MRVCYLLPRLLPGESGVFVGGCVTNCVALALELKNQGIEIELIAPVPMEARKYLSGHPVEQILTPLEHVGRGWVGKGIASVSVLRRELKSRAKNRNYDVVHSHSGTYPYGIVPLVVNRRKAVRLHSLYCPVGAEGGRYSSWWEKPIIAKMIFERLDRIIAVTGNIRSSIERAGVSPNKIELISMAVDTKRFSANAKKRENTYFPAGTDCVRLLFIGNSSREKGLVELLHAVKILIEKDVRVHLIATIENQSNVRELIRARENITNLVDKLGMWQNVEILGLVDDIEALYSESDVVVVPWNSTRGPSDYPMVALEAMAMGKCIVSTPVGGCRELLLDGEAGILTDGVSIEAITTSLEYACRHPQVRQQKGLAALAAARNLSIEASANRLVELYEQLLKKKG